MTKTVTRYEILDRNGSDENVAGHPKSDGEWVRYDDIKHLLHDEPRSPLRLPTYEESRDAVARGDATPLQEFIYGYEPSLCDQAFRGALAAAVAFVQNRGAPHE